MTSSPLTVSLGGHWYSADNPAADDPELATPALLPVIPAPGVQLPQTCIQMTPAAAADAANINPIAAPATSRAVRRGNNRERSAARTG